MSHFNIKCRHCGKELREVYCAFCEHCKDALLVTEYKDERFSEDNEKKGIWRFNWIPVHGTDFEQSGTLVYKSEKLSGHLGLENLYIA
ncbi:MAG: cysteate synthase, partial [Nitrospirota bacterium]|nr:cysteate synthase [Nitrospirota bacterium]